MSTTTATVESTDSVTAVLDAEVTDQTSDPMPDANPDTSSTEDGQPSPEIPFDECPLTSRIEAILISTDRQITEARLAEVLGLSGKGSKATITKAVADLNEAYEREGRAFRVERLAGGLQILTLPAFGPLLASMQAERQSTRLSQAALETLAIIAYRQPIMRAEVEAIRGVACGEVLRGLIDRRMVKIVGRAEELGRPMLYGTTRQFLETFGLASLDDLPTVAGLVPTTTHYTPAKPKPTPEEAASDGVGSAEKTVATAETDVPPDAIADADATAETVPTAQTSDSDAEAPVPTPDPADPIA